MNESVEKFCRLRRIVGPGDVSAIASTPSAVPQPPPPTKLDVQGEGALTHPIPSPKLQEASVVTLNLALKPCPEVSPCFQKLTSFFDTCWIYLQVFFLGRTHSDIFFNPCLSETLGIDMSCTFYNVILASQSFYALKFYR